MWLVFPPDWDSTLAIYSVTVTTLGPTPQTNPPLGSGIEKTSGGKEDIWLEIDQTPSSPQEQANLGHHEKVENKISTTAL